ncbi:MAG TPA: isopentenyl-diphosphate Delta-isomerase [Gammaproteobacteria bacterium]|nr:isopentenyl-diphosphate Delta-isomerase [Gammaproteobacteria bacterium]
MARDEIVSSASEELILVDELDREIGHKPKAECHTGNGVLHRAFSIFVFNGDDELLLQQRSLDKPLWPSYWSNTCCSHPRRGESMEQAVSRRLIQELGFDCPLEFLYKFKYHAQYGALGAEHEYCWVYFGRYDGPVDANVNEIAALRFVPLADLEAELEAAPDRFTPWFKMEWAHIRHNFLDSLLRRTGTHG